jgi:hypothetical protein
VLTWHWSRSVRGITIFYCTIGEQPTQSAGGGGLAGMQGPGYACVAVQDLCRNLFDMMVALPESLLTAGGEGEVSELQSWCGAAEVCVCELCCGWGCL